MQLNFDPRINYECVQCGKGCFTDWGIAVKPEEAERLKDHPLTLRVIEQRGAAFEPKDCQLQIYKNADNPRCGYLEDDNRCSIHAQIGYAAKPLTCKEFPYILIQVPTGETLVSASYYCTAVAEDVGPPLQDSLPVVEDLLQAGARVLKFNEHVPMLPRILVPYRSVAQYEAELRQRLAKKAADFVLEDAIVALASALASQSPPAAGNEPLRLSSSFLGITWDDPAIVSSPLVPVLPAFKENLVMGLLKPCLPSQDRAMWQRLDAALSAGEPLDLPDFNWQGPLSDLHVWVEQGVALKFEGELSRYRDSLLFRKEYLIQGGVLPGLIMLWLVPHLVRLLTGLQAFKNEREPELQDYHWAVGRVETRVVGHTTDAAQIFIRAAQLMMSMTA